MAAKVEVKLISSGVRDLLHTVGETACKSEADAICKRCGDGYVTDTKKMGTRTVASVSTDTPEAMADNLKHNTLLKAM